MVYSAIVFLLRIKNSTCRYTLLIQSPQHRQLSVCIEHQNTNTHTHTHLYDSKWMGSFERKKKKRKVKNYLANKNLSQLILYGIHRIVFLKWMKKSALLLYFVMVQWLTRTQNERDRVRAENWKNDIKLCNNVWLK